MIHRVSELAIGSIDETATVYVYPETRDLWNESYAVPVALTEIRQQGNAPQVQR